MTDRFGRAALLALFAVGCRPEPTVTPGPPDGLAGPPDGPAGPPDGPDGPGNSPGPEGADGTPLPEAREGRPETGPVANTRAWPNPPSFDPEGMVAQWVDLLEPGCAVDWQDATIEEAEDASKWVLWSAFAGEGEVDERECEFDTVGWVATAYGQAAAPFECVDELELGDVDGDGHADLVLIAYEHCAHGMMDGGPALEVFLGSPDGPIRSKVEVREGEGLDENGRYQHPLMLEWLVDEGDEGVLPTELVVSWGLDSDWVEGNDGEPRVMRLEGGRLLGAEPPAGWDE